MVGRRGSSFGLQLFSVAIVLVMFVYGFYLYRGVSSQLEKVEKDNGDLIGEKEDLSKDIQVLRESKTQLEQMLKEKHAHCSENEERLGSQLNRLRDDLSKEMQERKVENLAWKAAKKNLEEKMQDLDGSKSELGTKLDECENNVNDMKDENFELKKTRQESLNEVAKLNDEVANLARRAKELLKYKDLYEKLTFNDSDKQSSKKVVNLDDEPNMQIEQPGNKVKGYFNRRSRKPDESLKEGDIGYKGEVNNDNGVIGEQPNQARGGDQVAPPKIVDDHKEDKGLAKKPEDDKYDKVDQNPDQIPIKKQDEQKADDNNGEQVEAPEHKEKNHEAFGKPQAFDAGIQNADKLKNKPDGEVQAPKGQGEGDDDEDLQGEKAPEGEREAPQGERQGPDGANDNDVELDKQEKEP